MPLTAEQDKHITRKLTSWLTSEKRVVTFREVAREAGCHVDIAKNVLLSHARNNPNVSITYLLSGPLQSTAALATTQLPSDAPKLDAKALAAIEASQRVRIVDMDEVSDGERNSEDGTEMGEGDEPGEGAMDVDDLWGNDKGGSGGISGKGDRRVKVEAEEALITPEETPRWGVVMASQEQFEEKRALFDPDGISIHIYALSPGPVSDPAQYLISNTLLRQYPNYNDPKYGGIIGDLATGSSSSSGTTSKGAAPLKDGGMDFGSGSGSGSKVAKKDAGAKSKSDVSVPNPVEKEVDTPPAVAKPVKGKESKVEAETEGKKGFVAKSESSKAQPNETEPSPTPAAAASSASGSRRVSQSQNRSKKRIVTSDDEDAPATDTAEPDLSADIGREQTSSVVRADDQAAMEAMMGMDFEMGDGDEQEEEVEAIEAGKTKKTATMAKEKAAVLTAGGGSAKKAVAETRGRKRRKVKKSRTEMDDKGYMVTKDYTSEESYSGESDPEPSTSTKSKSKAKPTTKAKAAPPRKGSISASASASRASSVSTETNEDQPPRRGQGQAASASASSIGSAAAGKSGTGGGGVGGGGAGAARPGMPPKNVPGKPGKPKGQSTLAGFFKKK